MLLSRLLAHYEVSWYVIYLTSLLQYIVPKDYRTEQMEVLKMELCLNPKINGLKCH